MGGELREILFYDRQSRPQRKYRFVSLGVEEDFMWCKKSIKRCKKSIKSFKNMARPCVEDSPILKETPREAPIRGSLGQGPQSPDGRRQPLQPEELGENSAAESGVSGDGLLHAERQSP